MKICPVGRLLERYRHPGFAAAVLLALSIITGGCEAGSTPAPAQTSTPLPSPTATGDGGVPLPTEQDAIYSLFALIDEGRAASAVETLAAELVPTDSARQAWAVQFNAFESVRITSIDAWERAAWTDRHLYRVVLDVRMKPASATAEIPYYGWQDGENVRFITLIKPPTGVWWKIAAIGTGP